MNGNFAADPLFWGPRIPRSPNSLGEDSPCAPANQPACGLIGARDVGCDDPTAVDAVTRITSRLSAHPNPFNPRTTLRFTLSTSGLIQLSIHDLAGRQLRVLIDDELFASGAHGVSWNGKDGTGSSLASGVYLVRLDAGHESARTKVILLK